MLGAGQPVPARSRRRAGYDGPGPNPLLQNHPLMAIHPPMLYLGYVGFTVPFAFAVAALVTGRVGEGWLVATRRWTLIAWGFLTVGIVLGAWWSYEVLGWGGYWAWDPVENASFLPWLTGTAFLHSVMVQERRGMLRVWNLSLVLRHVRPHHPRHVPHPVGRARLGARLQRLAHRPVAARRSSRVVVGRRPAGSSPGAATSCARRAASTRRCSAARARFLANNLLFAAFAFVVLLGTVFPLLVEALQRRPHLRRRAVLRPHDDAHRPGAAVPHGGGAGAAVAQGVDRDCSRSGCTGRRGSAPARSCSPSLLGARGLAPLLAFGLGGFAAGAALRQLVLATRRPGLARASSGRTNGGMVVHLGVVLIAVALAAVAGYATEREVTLDARARRPSVAGHDVELVGTDAPRTTPGQDVTKAQVRIDGGQVYEPALHALPQRHARRSARRRCARASPRTCTSPSLPGTDFDAGVVGARG